MTAAAMAAATPSELSAPAPLSRPPDFPSFCSSRVVAPVAALCSKGSAETGGVGGEKEEGEEEARPWASPVPAGAVAAAAGEKLGGVAPRSPLLGGGGGGNSFSPPPSSPLAHPAATHCLRNSAKGRPPTEAAPPRALLGAGAGRGRSGWDRGATPPPPPGAHRRRGCFHLPA